MIIVIPYLVVACENFPIFCSALIKIMVNLYIHKFKEKSLQLYDQTKRAINLRKYPETASKLYEYYTQHLYAHLKIKDPRNIPPIYYESIVDEMKFNTLPEDIQSGIICLNMIDRIYSIEYIIETLKRINSERKEEEIDNSTLYINRVNIYLL